MFLNEMYNSEMQRDNVSVFSGARAPACFLSPSDDQRIPRGNFLGYSARKLTLPLGVPSRCVNESTARARESERSRRESAGFPTYTRSSPLFFFRRQLACDVDRLLHRRHEQHDVDVGYSLLADGQPSGGAAQTARGDRRRDRPRPISQSGG